MSLVLLVAAILAIGSTSASAAYLHPASSTTFGPDGTPASGFSFPRQIAIDQAGRHLFTNDVFQNKLFGFDLANPYTPLTGNFPLVPPDREAEHQDIAIDNTALSTAGNIYYLSQSYNDLGDVLEGYDSTGSPLGGVFPIEYPADASACGVAVDGDGHIWVSELSSQGVIEYSSAGQRLRSVGPLLFGGPCDIAFDTSTGDLYASNFLSGSSTLARYTAASGYKSGVQLDDVGPSTIAVDSNHSILYTTNGGSEPGIHAYNADGVKLETVGSTRSMGSVDIDESTGTIYGWDGTDFSHYVIRAFPGVVIPDVVTQGVSDTTVHADVDSAAAGDVTSCEFEYGTTASYGSSLACSPAVPFSGPTDVSANLPGLTREVLYHYRARVANANGTNIGADRTFIPHYVVDLKTQAASGIEKHGATLNATYTGTGLATNYYFEWGPTTAYGNKTATPPGDNAGSGTGLQPLTAPLTGLTSDSTYHYRIVASNIEGISIGFDRTFSTAAAVTSLTTDGITGLTGSTATLHGSWTGDGTDTHFYFQWGFGNEYGNTTPAPPGEDQGSGVGPQAVSVSLTNLLANATYHYRIVASNAAGTSFGADGTFNTPQLASTKYLPILKLTTSSAELRATVNPKSTGSTTYHFEYGPDPAYGTSTPESESIGSDSNEHLASAVISGLAAGTTYHYRLVATSPSGIGYGADKTMTTVPNLPTITIGSPSSIDGSGAILNAEVRPGFGLTVTYFQYGSTPAYGLATVPAGPLSADDSPHPISAAVSGLSPDTAYHYRVVASNFGGTSYGPDQVFTTAGLPKLSGGSASGVGQTTATLSAFVNPSLSPTTFHFDYGKDASYGSRSAESTSLPPDDAAHMATTDLAGLSPGTTYHYRLVATNALGTVTTINQTFTTTAPMTGNTPPKCGKGKVRRHGKCVKKRKRTKHQKRKGR